MVIAMNYKKESIFGANFLNVTRFIIDERRWVMLGRYLFYEPGGKMDNAIKSDNEMSRLLITAKALFDFSQHFFR